MPAEKVTDAIDVRRLPNKSLVVSRWSLDLFGSLRREGVKVG